MATKPRNQKHLSTLLTVLLLPFLLVYGITVLVFTGLYRLLLTMIYCFIWSFRAGKVIFAYSESPHWKGYLESEILPFLPASSVTLNISRVGSLRGSFEEKCYRHWSGSQEYCPIAIVFRPFRPPECYRFYSAFLEAKHGHPERLNQISNRFLEQVCKHVPVKP